MSDQHTTDRAKAYTEAGVDIHAGNALVDRIKTLVAGTQTHGTLTGIGGFGGLYKPDMQGMDSPVLVGATDGVGTKLKLAFAWNHHSTVGIDLVAMSVNDVVVQGAKPLFFLDYFATGKLDVDTAETVVAGVAEGCKQSGCVLLGGETAEMPSMYPDGEYDLAGFCVGMVNGNSIIDGSAIRAKDCIIGLASSGPHSNGYSLIRKILEQSGLAGNDVFPGTDKSVKDVLLAPTIIYAECIRELMADTTIHGMAHITGGGFYDNIPRVLPAGLSASINFGSWDIAPVFHWLKEQGGLSWPEMLQIFNCGIGYVLVVPADGKDELVRRISASGIAAFAIGTVETCKDQAEDRVVVHFPE